MYMHKDIHTCPETQEIIPPHNIHKYKQIHTHTCARTHIQTCAETQGLQISVAPSISVTVGIPGFDATAGRSANWSDTAQVSIHMHIHTYMCNLKLPREDQQTARIQHR